MSTAITVIGLSDLHFGKAGWNTFPQSCIDKAQASVDHATVLYYGGDLCEPDPADPLGKLREALRGLSNIPADVRLFVAGNNDLQCLRGPLESYAEELSELLSEYGFHVLDERPKVVGNVAFVGNIGWYDGSLWRSGGGTREQVFEKAEAYFRMCYGHRAPGWSSSQFFKLCQARIRAHLTSVLADPRVEQVVLGTHFVPSSRFCLYGNSERYDYLNFFMGYDAARQGYFRHEKIVLGFTGHTHRPAVHDVDGTTVHNLSGVGQPSLFTLSQRDTIIAMSA